MLTSPVVCGSDFPHPFRIRYRTRHRCPLLFAKLPDHLLQIVQLPIRKVFALDNTGNHIGHGTIVFVHHIACLVRSRLLPGNSGEVMIQPLLYFLCPHKALVHQPGQDFAMLNLTPRRLFRLLIHKNSFPLRANLARSYPVGLMRTKNGFGNAPGRLRIRENTPGFQNGYCQGVK